MSLASDQKAKLKEILDLVEYEGQTFAAREAAGTKHIYDTVVTQILANPTVSITRSGFRIVAKNTMQNDAFSTYRIRTFQEFLGSVAETETVLEELTTLFIEQLFNEGYMFGNNLNAPWEHLTIDNQSELMAFDDNMFYIDFLVTARSTYIRQPNQQ